MPGSVQDQMIQTSACCKGWGKTGLVRVNKLNGFVCHSTELHQRTQPKYSGYCLEGGGRQGGRGRRKSRDHP